MSQNGIRKAAAEDKEHGVAQNHLSTMWQIDCRLLLTSINMATCTINT